MRDGPGRHSGCPLHRQVCVSRWKDGLGACQGSTRSGFAVLSRSRLSSGAGEAQSLLCVACVVIHRLCCRAALWVGSGSGEALSWLSESEHRLPSSAVAAACPILIPLAQGTGSPGGHFLPSAFFSRQGPLVGTGHLTSCSHGWWLCRLGLSARWQQHCPALGAPSTALVLCSCRELPLLRLPIQIQGLLLPDGVGRAGDKGPPDALHSFL